MGFEERLSAMTWFVRSYGSVPMVMASLAHLWENNYFEPPGLGSPNQVLVLNPEFDFISGICPLLRSKHGNKDIKIDILIVIYNADIGNL